MTILSDSERSFYVYTFFLKIAKLSLNSEPFKLFLDISKTVFDKYKYKKEF